MACRAFPLRDIVRAAIVIECGTMQEGGGLAQSANLRDNAARVEVGAGTNKVVRGPAVGESGGTGREKFK